MTTVSRAVSLLNETTIFPRLLLLEYTTIRAYSVILFEKQNDVFTYHEDSGIENRTNNLSTQRQFVISIFPENLSPKHYCG